MHRLLLSLLILTSSFAWCETKQPVTLLIWFGDGNLTHTEFERYTTGKQDSLSIPVRTAYLSQNDSQAVAVATIQNSLGANEEVAGLLIASDGENKRSKNILREAITAMRPKWAKDLVVFLDQCATVCDLSFGIVHRAEDLYGNLRAAGVETLWTWSASNDFVTNKDMKIQAAILSLVTSADIGVIGSHIASSATIGILSALASWLPTWKMAKWMLTEEPLPPSGTLVKIHDGEIKNVQVDASQLNLKTFPECVKDLAN